jgi:hypothetical protein
VIDILYSATAAITESSARRCDSAALDTHGFIGDLYVREIPVSGSRCLTGNALITLGLLHSWPTVRQHVIPFFIKIVEPEKIFIHTAH